MYRLLDGYSTFLSSSVLRGSSEVQTVRGAHHTWRQNDRTLKGYLGLRHYDVSITRPANGFALLVPSSKAMIILLTGLPGSSWHTSGTMIHFCQHRFRVLTLFQRPRYRFGNRDLVDCWPAEGVERWTTLWDTGSKCRTGTVAGEWWCYSNVVSKAGSLISRTLSSVSSVQGGRTNSPTACYQNCLIINSKEPVLSFSLWAPFISDIRIRVRICTVGREHCMDQGTCSAKFSEMIKTLK